MSTPPPPAPDPTPEIIAGEMSIAGEGTAALTRHRAQDAETQRLREDAARTRNWKRWGPYLSERQWGTVREDYSETGECWDYLPHDHARSRAYRWGEDGLMGFTDRECRLCFALGLWNGKDPILKERLFGLTGPEGNHGEDVKECYWYLDSTPTHSYVRTLYKYPQAAFPYARLLEESRRRSRLDPEFELWDAGVFAENRYFDVEVEYCKQQPNDILVRVTVKNRGPEAAQIHVLPTLWLRNTWAWGRTGEGYFPRSTLRSVTTEKAGAHVLAEHASLGAMRLAAAPPGAGIAGPTLLFCENETNFERLFEGAKNTTPWPKDAIGRAVIEGRPTAGDEGTKAAFHYKIDLAPGARAVLRLRLHSDQEAPAGPLFGTGFEHVFEDRIAEADDFYASRIGRRVDPESRKVVRQAYAGLLQTKQFYHYIVSDWLDGDPAQPPPPAARKEGRNRDWRHVYSRDILSMPDKWEYPWFAAWDLAFHMIPFASIDPTFAKEQLALLTREWYMHPNGQLPAYEFAFGDVNPPVHAWAAWRVYKLTGPRGGRDRIFLARMFKKLLINFTWWVNRKDVEGRHIFAGGFLGLDNIGVFDRSKPLPGGGRLEQADGTAWMAFYCATMLAIALELAREDPAYEDIASKFFEHFVAIADAMNTLGGTGLWDEQDGFYYDKLHVDGSQLPLRIRSMVGIIPLFAVEILEQHVIDQLPGFKKRLTWFFENRQDLARHISYLETDGRAKGSGHRLLAIPSRERLLSVLKYALDESEFLSPHGVRSLSKVHRDHPFRLDTHGESHQVAYTPGESDTFVFGGNSNWRGPIWIPVNYLLIEALERYHHFYGDDFKVECPTGSGQLMHLGEVAAELGRRLARIFLPDAEGRRPCNAALGALATDPGFRDNILFHEYFHGDSGMGLGASHQTGWTALVARLFEDVARRQGAEATRRHVK